jgi:hypothetical protein
MRALFISAILVTFLSECDSSGADNAKWITSMGQKFFVYDAIDYYVNDFDESKIKDLYDNRSKSEIDSFRMGIILGNIPKSISDLAFIEMLPNVGYTKTQIDPAKFARIDGIFVEKTTMNSVSSPCIYVYRDILIFKKENKVVGKKRHPNWMPF